MPVIHSCHTLSIPQHHFACTRPVIRYSVSATTRLLTFHWARASTHPHAEVVTEPTCAAIASAVRARLDTPGAAPLPAPVGDKSSLLTAASTSLSARAHAAASAAAAHPAPELRDPQSSPTSLCAVCRRSGMVRLLFPAAASVLSPQAALALECFDDAGPIMVWVYQYHAPKTPLEVVFGCFLVGCSQKVQSPLKPLG